MKCLNLDGYVIKLPNDVIQFKYLPKNAQVSESDFGEPQKLAISRYLNNLKNLGVFIE